MRPGSLLCLGRSSGKVVVPNPCRYVHTLPRTALCPKGHVDLTKLSWHRTWGGGGSSSHHGSFCSMSNEFALKKSVCLQTWPCTLPDAVTKQFVNT